MDSVGDWVQRRLRLAVARAGIRSQADTVRTHSQIEPVLFDFKRTTVDEIRDKAIGGALDYELSRIIAAIQDKNSNR